MAHKIQLTGVDFKFNVGDIYYQVWWTDNPHKSEYNRKYMVTVVRGGRVKANYYTDLYINKTNSIDILKMYLNDSAPEHMLKEIFQPNKEKNI